MEPKIDIKELLTAGAHFGHQTRRWNPKMRPYIFTQRDGVHIIDLEQTVAQAASAFRFLIDVVAQGDSVLFVGTKKQARETIQTEATRAGQFYVNNRWMGGTLTNFKTIKASIDRLNEYYDRKEKGELEKLKKRERLQLERNAQKLEQSLGGIKTMTRTPGAMFIVDPNNEKIAQNEAKKLGMPIIAMIDTNGNPDHIDHPIPCNDDAIRSIQYIVSLMADACLEGAKKFEVEVQRRAREEQAKKDDQKPVAAKEKKIGTAGKAYTAKKPTEKGEEISQEELDAFAKAKAEGANDEL